MMINWKTLERAVEEFLCEQIRMSLDQRSNRLRLQRDWRLGALTGDESF